MLFVVLAVVGFSVAWLVLQRRAELFCLAVEDGKVRLVRGRAPGSLLRDFGDAVRGVSRGKIKAYRAEDGARLTVSGGIDAGVAQRLRNVFRTYNVSRLRGAEVEASTLAGKAVGFAAIVALLESLFF